MRIGRETYEYKRVDGNALKLCVYLPLKAPKGCVMLIHGGGWQRGDAGTLSGQAAYFAESGALSVCVDYRLIGGEVDIRDGLADCVDALRFIKRYAKEAFGGLPVTALGDSAGGYYAACLGCKSILERVSSHVETVDFVVDLNGIVDLTGKWKYGIRETESERNMLLKSFSPLYNVGARDAPVLLMHGDRDKTVELNDSLAYQKALNAHNVANDLIVLYGASHAFILFDYTHENAYVFEQLACIKNHLTQNGLV
jgi:acetyl esterase/lipase